MADTPYFTTAEARAYPPLQDTAKYPDESIDAARQLAEQSIEDACGVAFVQRSETETLTGSGKRHLLLRWSRCTAVSAVTVNGTAYSSGQLATLVPLRDGRIYSPAWWPCGPNEGNVTVTYTHGYPDAALPLRVKRDAILLTRRWLVESPVDERTTQVSTEGGTISFLAAGANAPFDIPELVALVELYGERVPFA